VGGRCSTKSNYESIIISPPQALAIWSKLPLAESTLTMLAASTGLRISECLVCNGGYRIHSSGHSDSAQLDWWKDREAKNGNVKGYGSVWPRACGSFAGLAVGESIFPRHRLGISELPQKGKQPCVGKMLVADYLRPIALELGVLRKARKRDSVFMPCATLGFILGQPGWNPTVVQKTLRHSNVTPRLGFTAMWKG